MNSFSGSSSSAVCRCKIADVIAFVQKCLEQRVQFPLCAFDSSCRDLSQRDSRHELVDLAQSRRSRDDQFLQQAVRQCMSCRCPCDAKVKIMAWTSGLGAAVLPESA